MDEHDTLPGGSHTRGLRCIAWCRTGGECPDAGTQRIRSLGGAPRTAGDSGLDWTRCVRGSANPPDRLVAEWRAGGGPALSTRGGAATPEPGSLSFRPPRLPRAARHRACAPGGRQCSTGTCRDRAPQEDRLHCPPRHAPDSRRTDRGRMATRCGGGRAAADVDGSRTPDRPNARHRRCPS